MNAQNIDYDSSYLHFTREEKRLNKKLYNAMNKLLLSHSFFKFCKETSHYFYESEFFNLEFSFDFHEHATLGENRQVYLFQTHNQDNFYRSFFYTTTCEVVSARTEKQFLAFLLHNYTNNFYPNGYTRRASNEQELSTICSQIESQIIVLGMSNRILYKPTKQKLYI